MTRMSSTDVQTVKQWFEDNGRDDYDTTLSDLVSLLDEVFEKKNESDEWYALTADLIKQLEQKDGVKFTSRRK